MSEQSNALTNLNPAITKVQDGLRKQYMQENQSAQRGQIVFVGSSTMEIFPIDKLQANLGIDKVIYNRALEQPQRLIYWPRLTCVFWIWLPAKFSLISGLMILALMCLRPSF